MAHDPPPVLDAGEAREVDDAIEKISEHANDAIAVDAASAASTLDCEGQEYPGEACSSPEDAPPSGQEVLEEPPFFPATFQVLVDLGVNPSTVVELAAVGLTEEEVEDLVCDLAARVTQMQYAEKEKKREADLTQEQIKKNYEEDLEVEQWKREGSWIERRNSSIYGAESGDDCIGDGSGDDADIEKAVGLGELSQEKDDADVGEESGGEKIHMRPRTLL